MAFFEYKYMTNFWDINPEALVMREFKDLYEWDKSKDKEVSSNLMWAIFFINDYHSRYANLPPSKRKELILKEWIYPKCKDKEEKHSMEEFFLREAIIPEIQTSFASLSKTYKVLLNDSLADYLESQKTSLESRASMLSNMPYDITSAIILDKMHLATSDIIKEIEALQERVNANKTQIRGNIELSPYAAGEIRAEKKYEDKNNLGSHGYNKKDGSKVSIARD